MPKRALSKYGEFEDLIVDSISRAEFGTLIELCRLVSRIRITRNHDEILRAIEERWEHLGFPQNVALAKDSLIDQENQAAICKKRRADKKVLA